MSDSELMSNGTKFGRDQKLRLQALIPEYEDYINKHNPNHRSHNKELKAWRERTAKQLIQEPDSLFKSVGNVEVKDWEVAICRFYTNYYNNGYLRRLKSSALKTGKSKSNSTTQSSLFNVDSSGTSSASSEKALDKLVQRAFVLFLGDLSAREMFASEHEAELQVAMNRIKESFPNLPGGALRNKALKELWSTADHHIWEEKIETLAKDVSANQAEFPGLIVHALNNLCSRNRLGSTLMSFSWAFRDGKDDGIKGGGFVTGHNSVDNTALYAVEPSDWEEQIDRWLTHADAVLPRKSIERAYTILLNENGTPLLPFTNVLEAGPAKMITLFIDYFNALWKASGRSKDFKQIPWTHIEECPSLYYDTSIYHLPIPLISPANMQKNPGTAYTLYGYFNSISDSTPFEFLPPGQHQPQSSSVHGTSGNIVQPNNYDSPSNNRKSDVFNTPDSAVALNKATTCPLDHLTIPETSVHMPNTQDSNVSVPPAPASRLHDAVTSTTAPVIDLEGPSSTVSSGTNLNNPSANESPFNNLENTQHGVVPIPCSKSNLNTNKSRGEKSKKDAKSKKLAISGTNLSAELPAATAQVLLMTLNLAT